MSIAVSVLTTGRVARNSGGAARQENRQQSALHIVPSVVCHAEKANAQTAHLVFAGTQSHRLKNQKSCFLPTLEKIEED